MEDARLAFRMSVWANAYLIRNFNLGLQIAEASLICMQDTFARATHSA